jgi:hypothetical protein
VGSAQQCACRPGQRFAEGVKGRGATDQARIEGANGFAGLHQRGGVAVLAGWSRAKQALPAAGQLRIAGDDAGHMAGARTHLARVDQGSDGLTPQAVGRAVPALPALVHCIPQRRCIAVQPLFAQRSGQAVGKRFRWQVTTGAGHLAVGRQTLVKEQHLAER